jgi:hypothetical protein
MLGTVLISAVCSLEAAGMQLKSEAVLQLTVLVAALTVMAFIGW